jgi:hypothetical protein
MSASPMGRSTRQTDASWCHGGQGCRPSPEIIPEGLSRPHRSALSCLPTWRSSLSTGNLGINQSQVGAVEDLAVLAPGSGWVLILYAHDDRADEQ